MKMKFETRWPMKQTGDRSFEVDIPMGVPGVPVINPEFREQERLNQDEMNQATLAALKSIAIIQ